MKLSLTALEGIPLIQPGDNLTEIIIKSAQDTSEKILDGDILVIAQKIFSKAEDRYVELSSVTPSNAALELAKEVDKDPRYVELVLQESTEVVRKKPGVLIVEHKLGFVHANAGIDQSNIEHADGHERVLLLPLDPDKSAETLRLEIKKRLNIDVAVIINDSIGRAWRNGTMGLAIGVSGMTALDDRTGSNDIFGRELKVTSAAIADELASVASLVMGQTTERKPVVLVRGYKPAPVPDNKGAGSLIRNKSMDLFR